MAKVEDIKTEKIKPEKFGDFDRIQDEFLPFLQLNSEQVPEVHLWENSHHYRMVIDIRQDHKDSDKISGIVHAGFKVVAYKVLKSKTIDEMTDEEFGTHMGEELNTAHLQTGSSHSVNIEDR